MAEGEQGFTGEEPAEASLARRIARGASRSLSRLTEGMRKAATDTPPQTETAKIPNKDVKALIADIRGILKSKPTEEFDVTIDDVPKIAALYFRVGDTGTHTTVHLVDPNETDADGLHPFSGVVCSERQKPDDPGKVDIRILGRNGQARLGENNKVQIVTIMGENVIAPGARRRIELAANRHRAANGLPAAEFTQAQQAIEQIKEQRSAA